VTVLKYLTLLFGNAIFYATCLTIKDMMEIFVADWQQ